MKTCIIVIMSIALFAVIASAAIINIPADYPSIQEGIDFSSNGDTVLVQPGTYVENINFNGHNIVLGSLFLVTLCEGPKPAGSHSLVWRADDFPSGLYFARLKVGERFENMKMVLLK